MKKSFYIHTLGCPKNTVDSEYLYTNMIKQGYSSAEGPGDAEIIILNTCGFIEEAKEESVETILELAGYKNSDYGKCELLVVMGCLVQKYAEELEASIPEADLFVGIDSYIELPGIISGYDGSRKNYVRDFKTEFLENGCIRGTLNNYAYLKISEGCDNNCTYCMIPFLKGKMRSRTMENVVAEAETLAGEGVTEIILISQDTTEYGLDLYGERKLCSLLEKLLMIEGLHWIRLLYCYPNHFSDELIALIRDNSKICNYVDIPLQHSSTSVLKRMNRKIMGEEIRDLIEKIRGEIPDMTVRSSFIAGFPGETEEDFLDLCDFLREYRLERVGIFRYSKEEGTAAAKLPDQIPEKVKIRRINELRRIQENILFEKNEELKGREMVVVADDFSLDYPGYWECRSQAESPDIDIIILVKHNDEIYKGKYFNVRIKDSFDYDLEGEVID